jgi:phosphoribosyl 1,2-cyclic phosphodiesterase
MMQKSAIPAYGDERHQRSALHLHSSSNPQADGEGFRSHPARVVGEFCIIRDLVPVPRCTAPARFSAIDRSFAYLTDCSEIPEASWPLLRGVRILVLDTLRERPHPTHLSLGQALAIIERLAPERAYLTHMCHDLPHAATCARLPAGVELAYDGLALDIAL